MSPFKLVSAVLFVTLCACAPAGVSDATVSIYPGTLAAVHVARPKSLSGDLEVSVVGLPVGVAAEPITMRAGENAGSLALTTSTPVVPGTVAAAELHFVAEGGTAFAPLEVTIQTPAPGSEDHTLTWDPPTGVYPAGVGTSICAVALPVPNAGFVYGHFVYGDLSATLPGVSPGTRYSILLHRFSAEGTWDQSFGTGGTVVAGGVDAYPSTCVQFALDAQQRIWIAIPGQESNSSPDPTHAPALMRLTADGRADSGFVGPGAFELGADLAALLPKADGTMVVVLRTAANAVRFLFLRADGSPDPAFGTGGWVDAGVNAYQGITASLSPDGTITLATAPAGGATVEVTEYSAAGERRSAFGSAGVVTFADLSPTGTRGPAAATLGVARSAGGRVAISVYDGLDGSLYLAMLTPDGALDATFGEGGVIREPLVAGSTVRLWPSQVAWDSQGRLLHSIQKYDGGSSIGYLLRRYSAAGGLELEVKRPESWSSMTLTPGDRVVLAGAELIKRTSVYAPALLRLWP